MNDRDIPRLSPNKRGNGSGGNKSDAENAGNAGAGVNGDSSNGRMNLWPKSGVSRSFVQKRMVREPLGTRFPDSERGESRARASFLIDASMLEASDRSKYQELEKLNQSPTSAEKRFSKTAPATLAADDQASDGRKLVKAYSTAPHEDTQPSPVRDELDGDVPSKKGNFFKAVFLSKRRNKK